MMLSISECDTKRFETSNRDLQALNVQMNAATTRFAESNSMCENKRDDVCARLYQKIEAYY